MTAATRDPLAIAPAALGQGSPIRFACLPDEAAIRADFAARDAGRERVVFILPVGPVGQFQLWAEACNRDRVSLRDLVVVNMDEYLDPTGTAWIAETDPLSFRAHMQRNFYDRLDPDLAPPEEARHFPDPAAPEATTALIDRLGGCDVCFGGVGITGHLAFNDPPEPGEALDTDAFADLPTRRVRLSRETRLINAVTACGGNLDRIPHWAVTVGMREILASRKLRIYMNRPWQTAIIRKLLHGPVTAAVPASLMQRHPDALVTAAALVTAPPEPQLR